MKKKFYYINYELVHVFSNTHSSSSSFRLTFFSLVEQPESENYTKMKTQTFPSSQQHTHSVERARANNSFTLCKLDGDSRVN